MNVLRLISQLIGIETLKLTTGIIIKILFGDRELVLFFHFIFFSKIYIVLQVQYIKSSN
jgi:hypothetical protein